MVAASPTVLRRHVALQLKELREAVEPELKREAVAEHLGCSLGHVRHLETLVSLPKPLEVRALLPLYGVPDRVERFLGLVEAARTGKDWWSDFPGVPSWLELLLGMEAAAATMHRYDALVVPGLFQTPAYTAAVIRAQEPDLSEAEVQQRIQLRQARQDVLTRRPVPPEVYVLLDEAVLYRVTEDPAVTVEQLEHLVKISALSNVHLQVVPFAKGLHAGINGPFTTLGFGPELVGDPGIAYTESRIQGTYYEQADQIQRYRDTWSSVQLQAATPEETRAILAHRAEEIAA